MDLTTLENWLWKAACSIRGEIDDARYKDYILPLVFYKRLDDIYADELAKVAANPMWNQAIATLVYVNDPYGRFQWGVPPASSADWGWIQHMYASLELGGRRVVVLDTGAVSRGGAQ